MSNYQGNMRGPGQKNRGRGGRPNMMGGGGQGNRPRPPHRMQNFDSSGPSVKIRGNAYQVFERYIAMAREASSAGDRVAAENLYQHAEHYYRIMQANGEGQQNPMGGQGRPMTPADTEMNPGEMDRDGPPPQAQPPAPDREGEIAALKAEVSRLQSALDAERAAAAPPEEAAPVPQPATGPWAWLALAAVLGLAAGFVLGWWVLDRRMRARFGGLRIF